MGKKLLPKLFRKKPSVDGSSGGDTPADAGSANNNNESAETSVNVAEHGKSSETPSAGPEETGGGSQEASSSLSKQTSFSYRPQSRKADAAEMDAVNGDPTKPQKADSNGSNGSASSLSNNDSMPRPIQVPTDNPKLPIYRASSGLALEVDSTEADQAYEKVPLLDIIELPRGGVSIETSAVGPVQFGIPPETIKDSMNLGLAPPSVYIVPVDRFCRDMGPALGVNLAEFEFPAYFNFFVCKKRCTLIVDSVDAERNIRKVFNETLLGPAQFRLGKDPLKYAEEDFAPEFPREAIPDFYRELKHFRIMPNGEELVLETLLKFCHFETAPDMNFRDNLGAPPKKEAGSDAKDATATGAIKEEDDVENTQGSNDEIKQTSGGGDEGGDDADNEDQGGTEAGSKKNQKALTYSQIRWIGMFLL